MQFEFLQWMWCPTGSVHVVGERKACSRCVEITLKCYHESINGVPL